MTRQPPSVRWLDAAAEAVLLAAVGLVPLGLGGNRVWAWAPLQVLVALAWALRLVRMALAGTLRLPRMGIAGWVAAALGALVLLQMAPLPAALVEWASPKAADLHRAAEATLGLSGPVAAGRPAAMTVSVAPDATRDEFLKVLAYAALFALVLNVVRSPAQARRLVLALILLGVFEAAYGIYESFTDQPHIFWHLRPGDPKSATGTFINRSHFASYLTMPLVLALGWMVRLGAGPGSRGRDLSSSDATGPKSTLRWHGHPAHDSRVAQGDSPRRTGSPCHLSIRLAAVLGDPRTGQRCVLAVAALIMAVAILLSRSRGVLVAMGLSALVAAALLGRRLLTNRTALVAAALVLAALSFGLWRALDRVGERLIFSGRDAAGLTGRLAIVRSSARLLADYPILGVGLGAYRHAYPLYQDARHAAFTVPHAHNDYLEWATEVGAAGAALLAGLGVLYGAAWRRAYRACPDDQVRRLAAWTLLAAVPILIHAAMDFGLHIPAVAVGLVTVTALSLGTFRFAAAAPDASAATTAGLRKDSRCLFPGGPGGRCAEKTPGVFSRRPRRIAWAAALGAFAVLAAAVAWPVRDLAAWLAVRAETTPGVFFASPAEAAAAATRALAYRPGDPALLALRARSVRADLEGRCRDAVPAMIAAMSGQGEGAGEVPAEWRSALAAAVWAGGPTWLIEGLQSARADTAAALRARPASAELHLAWARLELDLVRAGRGDAARLSAADRAVERALALAPQAAWVSLEAGRCRLQRWALDSRPEARASGARLLRRAVEQDPLSCRAAFEALCQAGGPSEGLDRLVTPHPYVIEEYRRFVRCAGAGRPDGTTIALPRPDREKTPGVFSPEGPNERGTRNVERGTPNAQRPAPDRAPQASSEFRLPSSELPRAGPFLGDGT